MSVRDDGYGGFSVGPSDSPGLATQFVILADGDDWQGVYIDGKLYDENHRLSMLDVFEKLSKLGSRVRSFEAVVIKDEWLLDNGRLPEYYSQIPEEAKCPRR